MSSKPESRKRAPGAGRKKIAPDLHTLKKTISLQPTTHDSLLVVGGGKLSKGVQIVTDFYLENKKLTKGKP
jgi:hypothetical protein